MNSFPVPAKFPGAESQPEEALTTLLQCPGRADTQSKLLLSRGDPGKQKARPGDTCMPSPRSLSDMLKELVPVLGALS